MKKHIGIAASLVISVLLLAAIACESSEDNPAPTTAPESITDTAAPTATPKTDTETVDIDNETEEATTAIITGTVTYRERIALSEGAVLIVKLVDVSRADAPSITIGEYEIANPGQVPLSFEIEYDTAEIDDRFTYAVQARINEGESLAFISDTAYHVITRDNPTSVDLVLVKVASVTDALPPNDNDGEEIDEAPAPVEYVEVLAPIESVEVIETDGSYTIHIVSGLPGGCVEYNGFDLSREGNTLSVTIKNLAPAPDALVMCTMIYGYEETDIELGESITAGEAYTVIVNGDTTTDFVAAETGAGEPESGEPEGPDMVETAAPIESVEVIEYDGIYTLRVVSGLPGGCVEYSGYDITREGNIVNVIVTNLAPAPDALVMCTAIYGYHETEIDLGDFVPGETYTVVVNGKVAAGFLAHDPEAPATEEHESPIEATEVTYTDSGYVLSIVSRLPMGSSCSFFDGYTVDRRYGDRIEVTVTYLGVTEMRPCTADLPVVLTEIALGSDFTPGESYTVVVNGDITNGFVARDPEGREMKVAESPIEAATIEASDGETPSYTLTVISRLPLGSSCSSFNGYDVTRRFADTIEVTVTHLEVTEMVPCTRDLPIVATEILLGTDFVSGETYKVIVNGETTEEFVAK